MGVLLYRHVLYKTRTTADKLPSPALLEWLHIQMAYAQKVCLSTSIHKYGEKYSVNVYRKKG